MNVYMDLYNEGITAFHNSKCSYQITCLIYTVHVQYSTNYTVHDAYNQYKILEMRVQLYAFTYLYHIGLHAVFSNINIRRMPCKFWLKFLTHFEGFIMSKVRQRGIYHQWREFDRSRIVGFRKSPHFYSLSLLIIFLEK